MFYYERMFHCLTSHSMKVRRPEAFAICAEVSPDGTKQPRARVLAVGFLAYGNPWKKGLKVMVKKTTSILVPLVPKMPKGDLSNEFKPNFDDFTVGMVAVKKDEKYPRTLRFENDVPIKTEAMVEKDVLETLTAFCGMNDSAGYLVTVEFNRANLSFRKNKKESKIEHALPRGFDCLLLELPILACALKTRGIEIYVPNNTLCFGSLSRKCLDYIKNYSGNYPGDCRLPYRLFDERATIVGKGSELRTLCHLSKIHGLTTFSPDYAEDLLDITYKKDVSVREKIRLVLDTRSSPDFIRKMNEAGFISDGVPAEYRDAILKKAREVFDSDLEIWDQGVAPMLKEYLDMNEPWVVGDFYGNPRKAELERESESQERIDPAPVRVPPVFRPE